MKRWKGATSYAERYMAKPEEFPEELQTGRIWGIWNEDLLPVQWEAVENGNYLLDAGPYDATPGS